MRPTDCAVFLKHRVSSVLLNPDGQPFASPDEGTCVVFARIDAAQRLCEAKVAALPHVRCEVYDSKGVAQPPLLVVVHPDFEGKENSGSIGRKIAMAVLLTASVPLFWAGTTKSGFRDFAIFLAINCILTALRLLYWDIGTKRVESERRRRLEAHRRQERGGA